MSGNGIPFLLSAHTRYYILKNLCISNGYRRMAVHAIFTIIYIYIYMRIYPTKYILYLYLAKQLDKQHLLKLYTLINVGRARRYLRCCEWILYDSSKGYFLYIFVSLAKI